PGLSLDRGGKTRHQVIGVDGLDGHVDAGLLAPVRGLLFEEWVGGRNEVIPLQQRDLGARDVGRRRCLRRGSRLRRRRRRGRRRGRRGGWSRRSCWLGGARPAGCRQQQDAAADRPGQELATSRHSLPLSTATVWWREYQLAEAYSCKVACARTCRRRPRRSG